MFGYVSSGDARNRLVAISGPNVSASFEYDALGRRTSKTINGVMTDYQYDGNDIVSEIGGGAVGATYLRSLNIDEPFVRQSSSNEYYHTDALGSVLALTDQTGVTQTTYRYDPFGNTTVAGVGSNPFQYTGRENDGTGHYFYRARYYNPTFQRFISQDPIGLLGGVNEFRYVDNTPTNLTDPSGLYGPLTKTLFVALVVAIGVDIALNIEYQEDNEGNFSITIPPLTMFEKGVPLPIPFGIQVSGQIVFNVPLVDEIGIPQNAEILVDPRFRLPPFPAEAALGLRGVSPIGMGAFSVGVIDRFGFGVGSVFGGLFSGRKG